eukprot:scaffold127882_cov38-Cyclotella_meneghiniana.AAC.1
MKELQSLPCLIVHHTPNETFKQSSCCEMVVWIQNHTILVWKVGDLMSKFPLPMTQKPACSDHCDEGAPISTLSHRPSYS